MEAGIPKALQGFCNAATIFPLTALEEWCFLLATGAADLSINRKTRT
jgi:hypothetical protein